LVVTFALVLYQHRTSKADMAERLIPQGKRAQQGNNFDAIRLSMALAVVWSHSFALHQGTEDREPVSLLLNGVYNSGNLAVMVFFMISGFLITQSFIRSRSLWSFMERRVRRIHPGYLVATSIGAFVVVPLYSTIMNMSVMEVAKTLGGNLLLRNYVPPSNAFTANPVPNAVNGSLWSIPFEFWCYIGVAALSLFGLLTRRWFVVFLLIVVLFGRVVLDLLDKKPGGGLVGLVIGWPYLWFAILPSFLLGMVAYSFQEFIPKSRLLLAVLVLTALSIAHLNHHLAHLLVAPTLAYGTFYAAFSTSVRVYGAARWGDFSYGTYLYAFPIQQMLFASYGQDFNLPAYIVLSMALSLFAGVCSWHLVEKRFISRNANPAPDVLNPIPVLASS
jgi:peptidoglycan/LPS O-acetylase OafA/YrhL